jgi:hypothetical protein
VPVSKPSTARSTPKTDMSPMLGSAPPRNGFWCGVLGLVFTVQGAWFGAWGFDRGEKRGPAPPPPETVSDVGFGV